MKTKKTYWKPSMQVVEIMNLSELLAASLGVTGLSTSNGIIWEDGEFGDSDYDR